VNCGCPGHTHVLGKAFALDPSKDRICKHAGAILLSCFMDHDPCDPARRRRYPRGLLGQPRPADPPLIAIKDARLHAIHRDSMLHDIPRARSPTTRTQFKYTGPSSSGRGRSPPKDAVSSDDDVFELAARENGLRNDPSYSEWEEMQESQSGSASKRIVALRPDAMAVFASYDEKAEEAGTLLKNGGGFESLLNARQAQKMACFLLDNAKNKAVLTAFTFDYMPICEALTRAAARKVDVSIFVDRNHTMGGTTSHMVDRLDQLRQQGVNVYLCKGPASQSGIQHSKSLYVDTEQWSHGYFLVGSTNWTTSSRSNFELNVLLVLTEESYYAVQRQLSYIENASSKLTAANVETSREIRATRNNARVNRAKSAEPDKFATAKRFSIARARSVSKAGLDTM